MAPVLWAVPAKQQLLIGLAEWGPELSGVSTGEIKPHASTKSASQGQQLCELYAGAAHLAGHWLVQTSIFPRLTRILSIV